MYAMTMRKINMVLGVIIWLLTSTAFAAVLPLEPRLGGLAYYDPDLDITWLADATSNGNSGNWIAQTNSIENTLNVAGITGWRLPSAGGDPEACPGDGCLNNEMGYMFNERGVNSGNMDVFNSVQDGNYFSATQNGDDDVWYFHFLTGNQDVIGPTEPASKFLAFTWAVHDGDVGALAVVPIPAAAWMFGSAIFGLFGFVRRKKSTLIHK